MSRVDVIIPCYKYAHYLRQCVESVLSQSHKDLRLLVIDDASPDDTPQVAQELVAQDQRVAYLRHEANRGHIATYNEGLEWAAGDYVLLLSADDLLTKGVLERGVTLLDDNASTGFIHGRQIRFDGDRPLPPCRTVSDYSWQVHPGREFLATCCETGENPVATPTAIVRNTLLRQLGGYRHDLPHTADMELWMRLAARAPVGWLETHQAYKRMHAANMQLQYQAALDELRHRRAAFSAVFEGGALGLAEKDHLRATAWRRLGISAFWAASAAFDDDDASRCQELLEFALSHYPELPSQPYWARFVMKRRLGSQFWRIVRPFADFVRGPFGVGRAV